jgi:hypothetical protein
MESLFHRGEQMMTIPADALPVGKAAVVLQVSAMTLYRSVKGRLGPGLRTYKRGGRILVSVQEARQYLEQHSQAAPVAARAEAPEDLVEELARSLAADPGAVLRRLTTDPALVASLGAPVARTMILGAEALRRAAEAERKAASLLTPAEFSKGLQAAMLLFVAHVEEGGARRCASNLVAFIRKTFGADLVNCNPSAVALLEREIRKDHNTSLQEFRQEIADRMRGARLLAFEAPLPSDPAPSAPGEKTPASAPPPETQPPA